MLVDSGLNCLFIGVESASQEILNTVNKGTKPEDILKTNEAMLDHDIVLALSYMFGLPGDSIEILRRNIRQIELLQTSNRYLSKSSWDSYNERIKVQTCFYQPYPGTELYQIALDWGYPKLVGLEEWGRLKPQTSLIRIPWLSNIEMMQYEKEFSEFFTSQ